MYKFQWSKRAYTQILIFQKDTAVHFAAGNGLPTVMDAHIRWTTEKNENVGITLEVTKTDDRTCTARDGKKA